MNSLPSDPFFNLLYCGRMTSLPHMTVFQSGQTNAFTFPCTIYSSQISLFISVKWFWAMFEPTPTLHLL